MGILKLKNVKKISKKYHFEILGAKYLLRTHSHDRSQNDNKNHYKFKDIEHIVLILPFAKNSKKNKCDLYVRPKANNQFVKIATIKYVHNQTMSAKLNHFFCCLKYFNKSI